MAETKPRSRWVLCGNREREIPKLPERETPGRSQGCEDAMRFTAPPSSGLSEEIRYSAAISLRGRMCAKEILALTVLLCRTPLRRNRRRGLFGEGTGTEIDELGPRKSGQTASVPSNAQNLIPQVKHSHLGFGPKIESFPTDTKVLALWLWRRYWCNSSGDP